MVQAAEQTPLGEGPVVRPFLDSGLTLRCNITLEQHFNLRIDIVLGLDDDSVSREKGE